MEIRTPTEIFVVSAVLWFVVGLFIALRVGQKYGDQAPDKFWLMFLASYALGTSLCDVLTIFRVLPDYAHTTGGFVRVLALAVSCFLFLPIAKRLAKLGDRIAQSTGI